MLVLSLAMSEATNLCCVKCNSILDRATFQGLEVDLCPKCGGLWLDRGEITRAAKLPETGAGSPARPADAEPGTAPGPDGEHAPCPACAGSLSEVMLGTVHVDYCNTCHGIFLDRGELQAAVEAVRAKARDTSRPRHRHRNLRPPATSPVRSPRPARGEG